MMYLYLEWYVRYIYEVVFFNGNESKVVIVKGNVMIFSWWYCNGKL